jgi:ketosteroid isomerase-like protein
VQLSGDIAVLTFNFKSFRPDSLGSEREGSHWHTTEVFRRTDGAWKLISTHWSYPQSRLMELALAGQLTGETEVVPRVEQASSTQGIPAEVIAMERAALDRWGAGDPGGFLDIVADEYTYFDPSLEERMDDRPAYTAYLEPVRGQVSTSRYEFLDPYVQTDGTTAVLSFNLKTYGSPGDGTETLEGHWHATEVYSRTGPEWKLISTHWSFAASWLEEMARSLRGETEPRP